MYSSETLDSLVYYQSAKSKMQEFTPEESRSVIVTCHVASTLASDSAECESRVTQAAGMDLSPLMSCLQSLSRPSSKYVFCQSLKGRCPLNIEKLKLPRPSFTMMLYLYDSFTCRTMV